MQYHELIRLVPASNSWQVISALSAVAGVVVAAIGWTLKVVSSIKDNHLKHIEDKLDTVSRGVEKIDDRLVQHLIWHADDKK